MTWSEVVAAIPVYGSLLAAIVTAIATFFLWKVTAVLAAETKRMVEAASRAHVVATLEPSRVSIIHFDLRVSNTGNATAYDIRLEIDPPVTQSDVRAERAMPLQHISVLKPGQEVGSFVSEFKHLQDQRFRITTSWLLDPSSKRRETNTFLLDMTSIAGTSRLGGADALTEISQTLTKMRDDWRQIAKGSQRIGVDIHSDADRERHREKMRREVEGRRQPTSLPLSAEAADDPPVSQ